MGDGGQRRTERSAGKDNSRESRDACAPADGESDSGESSLAEKQIFAEASEDNDDAAVCGIPVRAIRESVLSYKRDTKNFFIGDLLGSCSRRARRYDDQWYAWTKDMMESIDRNEEVMTRLLQSESHDGLGSMMRDGCKDWDDTIEDKVGELMDGLQSIESMVRSRRGMSTIWGRIKYRGVFRNNVRQYLAKAKSGAGTLDLVDYARHKGRRWDEHLGRMRSREEQESLYDFK